MRIIDVEDLREGMVTGYAIEVDGKDLLPKHTVLTESSINSIKINCPWRSRIWVLDLIELKPYLCRDSSLTNKLIEFLVVQFKLTFKAAILQPKSLGILVKQLSQFMYINRGMLYECLALRDKHVYTYSHSINVAMYSLLIGLKMELSTVELQDLLLGCVLHDIGKVHISDSILDKPENLDESEFRAIQQHPLYGLELARNSNCVSQRVLSVIGQHHEKLNGQGYPFGLSGDEIDLLAQITTVADIFDAVTSKRSYHDKKPPFIGVDVLNSEASRGKIFSDGVKFLVDELVLFVTGSIVILNNGEVCEVVEDCSTMRPKVFSHNTREVYDLESVKNLYIVDCI